MLLTQASFYAFQEGYKDLIISKVMTLCTAMCFVKAGRHMARESNVIQHPVLVGSWLTALYCA